jgi:Resolvase, N terminal domain
LCEPDRWVTVFIRYERNSPEKQLIGYARVSIYGQTLDSQVAQLHAVGCSSRNIYREKVAGARRPTRAYPHPDSRRPEWDHFFP